MSDSLLFTGAKYGKLTVVDMGDAPFKPHSHARKIMCECDCGSFVNTRAYRLVTGSITCCGCSDPLNVALTDGLVNECLSLASKVGCSLGLAYVYLRSEMSMEEIHQHFGFYRDHTLNAPYGTRYNKGGVFSHFQVEELGARSGTFCGVNAVYDLLRCACGHAIYMRNFNVRCGRMTKCRCDLLTDRINNHLVSQVETDNKVRNSGVPLGKMAEKNAPTTHGYICRKGPEGQGQCLQYCTLDDECLDYWAHALPTPHWKPGFECYVPPVPEQNIRRSSLSKGGFVRNGGYQKP